MRRPWKLFLFIVILAVGAGYVAWPNTPVKVQVGSLRLTIPKATTLELKQGLDLSGGTQLTLQVDMSKIKDTDRQQALESATAVIDRRVNLFGVSEPVVQSSKVGGDYRIIVELPGVKDINDAVNLVGRTAQLELREIADPTVPVTIETTKPTGITGADFKSAQAAVDSQSCNNTAPCVLFQMTDEGAKKFADLTTRLSKTQSPLPIFLDETPISVPTVNTPITAGSGIISGSFTVDSAKALATQLNAGALPAPIKIIEQRTIGATIGDLAAKRSLLAGIVGLVVIAIFMIGLYLRYGAVATLALLIYTLIVLAIFKLSTLTPYGVTLTLAGIAGFILSVGMAVDANILIFERMREELRRGKPRDVALELGFARAWTSIRDSNVATIVTAIIIYEFTTSFVKGFALTLLIGVIVSMFTAIVVTRTLLRMFAKY